MIIIRRGPGRSIWSARDFLNYFANTFITCLPNHYFVGRGVEVIYLTRSVKDTSLGLVDTFLISDVEVNRLRGIRGLLGYENRDFGSSLRALINVAFMNADVNYPPEVFIETYNLHRREAAEWVRVVAPRPVMLKVMTLASIAAQGIAEVVPATNQHNLVEKLASRPRLGVDFALVAFEYFVREDWKGAKYVWRVGRLRGGEA